MMISGMILGIAGCGGAQEKDASLSENTTQSAEVATQATEMTEATTVATEATEATTEAPVPEVKMYTTEDINLKEKDDKDSETLCVIPIGKEVKVVKEGEEWTQVEYEGKTGFVYSEYLTKNQEDVEAAKEAKAQEEAAALAAAQAEAEAEAEAEAKAAQKKSSSKSSSKSSKSSSSGSSKKKVVSKTKNDDCDGSGHGYYEIKYSDGSTEIQEY